MAFVCREEMRPNVILTEDICFCRDQFINGSICPGTEDSDTTNCVACSPQPSARHFTLNPCNYGQTRQDQVSVEEMMQ